MRYLVLCLVVFFSAVSSTGAQTTKALSASLSRDLEAYRRFTLALNFDSSLQYMPPKMFEIVPRDSLMADMLKSMDNEYMTIQLTGLDFNKKEKIKIKKAGIYRWAIIPYEGSMRLNFKGEQTYRALMINLMKGQMGKDNVKMEGDSIMQIALKNKQLIAFKDPASPIWSIIEDKRSDKGPGGESQKKLLDAVLPEEVLKALGAK